MSWYQYDGNCNLILTLYIQPGAKHTELAGLHGDALKIRLSAPPVEGKANKVLLKFLAERFQVPLRQVSIKQGMQSRYKIVEIYQPSLGPQVLSADDCLK
ncbi:MULTISPECIES: DUF167 domain-containing protein [Nitrosomonas]|uniref:UPF0235 protein AAW31_06405 n=1 Tax=Nitrosomonas communis TaxID=44574 RepID=A0A0F7KFI3_9PROT|nr:MULTISPECIES: DUF167 family protein [Nitrosomonas]AKH37532.1 hypothetical protein AAW31_06405 [Nitrosomonas communis]TYP92374.1 hypothetical protein BCL69_100659 [Nitrosomonas communis]UVS62786.1 DUF167 family protein [Nitrosomonas sp. PLL12]